MKKSIIIILLILLFLPNISYADVGPKPSLEIIVKGFENYYLDLLVDNKGDYSWLDITDDERKDVKKIIEYEDIDGYKPGLLTGTSAPMMGELRGEKIGELKYKHSFGYVGVPEKFKIIILTEDDKIIVSKEINRKHFQSKMNFDLRNIDFNEDINLDIGEVREVFPVFKTTIGFIIRLIATILIELGIALALGFTIEKSGKIILITNILTQLLLNIGIYLTNIYYGFLLAAFAFIGLEIIILIIESIIYGIKLKEKPLSKRIEYGIFANFFSFGIGIFISMISIMIAEL